MTSLQPVYVADAPGILSAGGKPASRESWFWLLGAAIALLFADGRLHCARGVDCSCVSAALHPCATFVARIGVAYFAFFLIRGITYRGIIPIPGVFYYLFLAVAELYAAVPYLMDRILVRRLHPGLGNSGFSRKVRRRPVC